MIFGGLPNLIIYDSLLSFVREKFLNNSFAADLRVGGLCSTGTRLGRLFSREPVRQCIGFPQARRSRLFQAYGRAALILIHILSV